VKIRLRRRRRIGRRLRQRKTGSLVIYKRGEADLNGLFDAKRTKFIMKIAKIENYKGNPAAAGFFIFIRNLFCKGKIIPAT
jgi:hypothetical protein